MLLKATDLLAVGSRLIIDPNRAAPLVLPPLMTSIYLLGWMDTLTLPIMDIPLQFACNFSTLNTPLVTTDSSSC